MQDKLFILPSKRTARMEQIATSNLPGRLTPLIGREREVPAACTLLRRSEVRLLTCTGAGGVGKTRLGLQVAFDLLNDFSDGVCFVSLAPVSDPGLVFDAIAQALDLKPMGEQPPLDMLKAYLREKEFLLLLDNFEQIVAAAPVLADLLAACHGLKALVTSRTVLRISGEYEFPVPPLALPDLKQLPESASLVEYAAIALFLQRAQAVKPDFQITSGNARAIAEICVKLDGLPLALELAAARIKLFPPQALLLRLERRFQVLTGGAKDLPARQQTLRNTLQWSYDLLEVREQQLFRLLSVFVGGCTLEAAEAVCSRVNGEAVDVLERVSSLIDKSLLQQTEREGKEPRLLMLETIREYGLECLVAEGEMENTRQAHAVYYLTLVEKAEPELEGPQPEVWLAYLQIEYDNLRAALQWSLECGAREQALRLAGALHRFWEIRGPVYEGREFLERALAESEGVDIAVRAKALRAAADLALVQDDIDQAMTLCEQSLALFRSLEDAAGIAHTFSQLGFVARMRGDLDSASVLSEQAVALARTGSDKATLLALLHAQAFLLAERGEYTRAQALFEERLTIAKEAGNKLAIASSLFQLAQILYVMRGDDEEVRSLLEESRTLWKEMGDKDGLAGLAYLAGQLALSQGDAATARTLLDESLQLSREAGDRHAIADALSMLGKIVLSQRNLTAAQAFYKESLSLAGEIGDKMIIAQSLEGLATVIAELGEHSWAARLWGTAAALRETIGLPLPHVERATYEQAVERAREHLGGQAFINAWAEGRGMSPEQALAAFKLSPALTQEPMQPRHAPPNNVAAKALKYPGGLSAREVEVLRLVAQGLTDAQVAETLVISPRTVNWHLTSIYSKLQISSRSAATRYAIEKKLI